MSDEKILTADRIQEICSVFGSDSEIADSHEALRARVEELERVIQNARNVIEQNHSLRDELKTYRELQAACEDRKAEIERFIVQHGGGDGFVSDAEKEILAILNKLKGTE